jgi:UDP-N-acetylglucosamine 2-epimerase
VVPKAPNPADDALQTLPTPAVQAPVVRPVATPVFYTQPLPDAVFSDLPRIVRKDIQPCSQTVLCLVDSQASYYKAALLALAFESTQTTCRVVVVVCKTTQHLGPMENYAQAVDLPSFEVDLGVSAPNMARCVADSVLRFEALLAEFSPDLVLPLGGSDQVATCALLAARTQVPVVRAEAGWLPPPIFAAWHLNSLVLDRIAKQLYTESQASAFNLTKQGIAAEQVQVVGSLAVDAIEAAQRSDVIAKALLAHHGLNQDFILVTTRIAPDRLSADSLPALLKLLTKVRGSQKMLWLVCGETQSALRSQGLGSSLSRSGIALASTPMFSARLCLLKRATCLIADETDELIEMALGLGKKIALIDEFSNKPASANPSESVRWLPMNADDLGPLAAERNIKNPTEGAALALAKHVLPWLINQTKA